MVRKKTASVCIIILILLLLTAGLFYVNRDVFKYTYSQRCERTFTPGIDLKQDYVINGPIALKPGSYMLSPQLSAEGDGSGIFLIDGDENELFFSELTDGTKDPSIPFEISGNAEQVRVGIRYNEGNSFVQTNRITITADHVLYRESILWHLTVSCLLILFAFWLILRLLYPEQLWKLLPVFAKPENELALLFLISLTAAASYPILNGQVYIHGDDMFFHATRIRGLADSLQAGYFPVRDQLYWLHNYGYGVGFYYPDVFLYFPAALVLLGFDLLTAYNIFLITCTFFSVVSIWYAGLRITKNRAAAAASAILFAFAAYRLINIYYRAAIGEVQAAVFFPLITLGLYEIFHGNKNRWPVFALGFLGIFCCHIISLAIAVFLTAVFLLIRVKRILQDKEIIIVLIKSVLFVAGLGAFFWLPMLEQSLTNPGLKVNNLIVDNNSFNTINYAFPIENIFVRFKVWNWAWQADSVYPGWIVLLVPIMAALVWNNRDDMVRTSDFMLLFSLPVIWMGTRSFPWEWNIFRPFVTRIQFAYRLLLPATVLLCLSGGIYFTTLVKNRKPYLWLSGLALFCFFSTAFPILQESAEHRSVEKQIFVMQDNRVSGEEYLPSGLHKDYPGKNADTVNLVEADIPLTITAHDRQKLGFSFTYEIPEDSGEVHFSVPLIYYTGFRGTLTTEDGNVLYPEITWDDMGLVALSNEGYTRGSVSVKYQKTPVQWVGECVALITLICLLCKNSRFLYRRKG